MKRRDLALSGLATLIASRAASAQTAAPAAGKTLRVGLSQETTSLYPNWFVTTGNQQIASHIFDNLVQMDASSQPQPGLAESWRSIDPLNWEFKLRRGVTFHDGTPFTADHVVTAFDHSLTIQGVGAAAGAYLRGKTYKKVDDFTLHISTTDPDPLLPNELTVVYIYPRAAPVEQFDSGAAAIGTGPYKLKEWTKASRIVLERNEAYWGPRPQWDRVELRPIVAPPSRVAALLNNEVDIINDVPPADVGRLRGMAELGLFTRAGERIMQITLDSSRDVTPYVLDNAGKPIWPNPLRDARVRKAISMSIDRDALVSRLMDGLGVAAGQIASPGMSGYDPAIKPQATDLAGAKKLLADAGYADGFRMVLHGPNDRYVNDAQMLQAAASMITRTGIHCEVETLPWAVFGGAQMTGGPGSTPAYSATLQGFGTATGETMSQLWMLLHTRNKERALGHANAGGYSNMRIDAMLEEAMVTFDVAARQKMLSATSTAFMNDVAVVPMFWQVNAWAARKGLTYPPRIMNVTHAMTVTSA
jgi:peptide/nickel transport system substrate-binding protein